MNRRHVRIAVLAVCLLAVASAHAQERQAVSGRSRPVIVSTPERASWSVSFGGGLLAGGDVFQVITDGTRTWSPPGAEAEPFSAERFTATLDEDAAFAVGLGRRLGELSWLRLDLALGEMDLTALANDSQFVTPTLYDRLSLLALSVSWEQRLLETSLAPYFALGLTHLDVDAGSEALGQSVWGGRAAVGLTYALGGRGELRCEAADHIVSLDASGIPQEGGHPVDSRFTELGPQHLFALTIQLQMIF